MSSHKADIRAATDECPFSAVRSTGHRNTLAKSLCRRLEVQRFSGSLVELARDLVETGLGVGSEIDAVRQILPQQAIGVLVGAPLPRALRIAEVDGDVGGQGEALVVGEFFSAIPGERLIEFVGQFSRLPDQRCYDGFGVAIGDLGAQHIAGVPLDQGDDEAILGTAKEIALPMAGDGAIFC